MIELPTGARRIRRRPLRAMADRGLRAVIFLYEKEKEEKKSKRISLQLLRG